MRLKVRPWTTHPEGLSHRSAVFTLSCFRRSWLTFCLLKEKQEEKTKLASLASLQVGLQTISRSIWPASGHSTAMT